MKDRPGSTAGGVPRPRWGRLLMTFVEAAEYVGLPETKLIALHQEGHLPAVRVGDRILLRRGDLAALPRRLAQRTGTAKKGGRGKASKTK